jgi:hypothetical protein
MIVRRLMVTAVALAGLLAASTGLALADPVAPGSHQRDRGTGQPCVLVLSPVKAGEAESRVVHSACGGKAAGPAPTGWTLLWIGYDGVGHSVPVVEIYGLLGPCDRQGYAVPDLRAYGNHVNDRISSFRVFNNCYATRVYEHINYGGAWTYFYGDMWGVGTLSNRVSSLKIWRP